MYVHVLLLPGNKNALSLLYDFYISSTLLVQTKCYYYYYYLLLLLSLSSSSSSLVVVTTHDHRVFAVLVVCAHH